jgi:hypothetical protein
VKQSPFKELESLFITWFKQTRGSNAGISGTLLREKAPHIITRLGITILKLLMAESTVSRSNSVV